MIKKFLCLAAIVLLVGCKGGGSGSAFSGADVVALPGGGDSGSTGGSIIIPEDGVDDGAHMNPEPTTLMLIGMGVSGIVASKFRKKRK
jgi:hypothetical protein